MFVRTQVIGRPVASVRFWMAIRSSRGRSRWRRAIGDVFRGMRARSELILAVLDMLMGCVDILLALESWLVAGGPA